MADNDRTKEVRGQAPRKEEMKQKKISTEWKIITYDHLMNYK